MAFLNVAEKSITRHRKNYPQILEYANENRKDELFTDVVVTVGDTKIPGNKLILSCCSKVFEKMFKSQMKEHYEPIANITADVNATSIKMLIEFIYTGTIIINTENVMQLLAAADYLQIDDIKQFCIEFLESILAIDTSVSILGAAHLYRIESLQNRVYEMLSSKFDEFIKTESFTIFTKNDVESCISKLDRNLVQETTVYEAIVTWTKFDEANRKKEFPELLQMLHFDNFSPEYLKDVVSIEKLIQENLACSNLVMTSVCKLLFGQRKVIQQESKIISIGGWDIKGRVLEVYRCDAQPINLDQSLPMELYGGQYHNLPIDLYGGQLLKLQDHFYCIGGYDRSRTASNRVVKVPKELQNPFTLQVVAKMKRKRSFFGAAVFCDCLVVSGGQDGKAHLSSTECYVPQLSKWTEIEATNQTKSSNALAACGNSLYSIGGSDGCNTMSCVQKLDGLNRQWISVQGMQTERQKHAAVSLNGYVYVLGGINKNGPLETVEKFDPLRNQWVYTKNMHFSRYEHSACVLRGKIYVIGGMDASHETVREIETYNPDTNTWSIVGQTTENLRGHFLVTL